MNIGHKFLLASKYLIGHFRRYIFLLLVLSFSFSIISTITSQAEGMSKNVFRASENHYAGHVFVVGFEQTTGTGQRIAESDVIIRSVKQSGLTPSRIVKRTLTYSNGELYFAGSSVKQKYVYGIDWEAEQEDFRKLTFIEGGADIQSLDNGIYLSEPVAQILKARVDDDILLELSTRFGQKNTQKFIVKGIIEDSSIFGFYKCFVDRRYLNELYGFESDECSSIGLYFDNTDNLFEKTEQLYMALKDKIPLAAPILDRTQLSEQMSKGWEGIRYFVFPLPVYISQVADLLTAMKLISYFLYVMMIIIAISSMTVTYRLILHERSKEIGTIRVLGLQSIDTQMVLIFESILLFVISIAAGFLFSLILNWILSLFSYSWIPGFDIFLQKGKLVAAHTVRNLITNILIMLFATIPAIWIPAFRASRTNLIDALSGGTL